jgi:hypothetical protein
MGAFLAKPSLNQCIAIIQKYQAAAISALASTFTSQVTPIVEFHKGPKMRTAPLWLTLSYEGTVFTEASQNTREQHLLLIIRLETGNYDSELAQDQAIDYLRMLDYIFNDLSTFADWETALPIQHESVPSGETTPWRVGTVKEMFIEREEQSVVFREEIEMPSMEVTLHIRLDLEEAI